MWLPGVQDGSSPPSGSARVNATTSSVNISRLVTTAAMVRDTGTTCDGFQRDSATNPPNTVNAPSSALKNRSCFRRP